MTNGDWQNAIGGAVLVCGLVALLGPILHDEKNRRRKNKLPKPPTDWACDEGDHKPVVDRVLRGGEGPDEAAKAVHCKVCGCFGWQYCDRTYGWRPEFTKVSPSPYPRGPLPPESTGRRSATGGCGVEGCGIQTPHSHVLDLVQKLSPHRVPEKKKEK